MEVDILRLKSLHVHCKLQWQTKRVQKFQSLVQVLVSYTLVYSG